MTAAFSVGLVLGREVLAEGSLGARAIFWRAARADFTRSISNDPNRALSERAVGVSVLGTKPETDSFWGTRHKALIFSISASVVKSLPATRSITSRPFAASLRNPLAVIDPSGNASAAATSSRCSFPAVRGPWDYRQTGPSLSNHAASHCGWSQIPPGRPRQFHGLRGSPGRPRLPQ
jgi:hypothetical protein